MTFRAGRSRFSIQGPGPCRPAMTPPTAPMQKIPCVAGSHPFCLAPCRGGGGPDDLPCGAVAGFFHPGTGPCRPAMSAPNGTAAKNPLRRRIASFLPGTLQGWRGSDDLPCGAVAGFFHPGTGPCRPAMSAPNGTAAKNPLRRRIATFLPGTLQGWRGSDDLPCGAVAGFFHPGTGPCRPAMSAPNGTAAKNPLRRRIATFLPGTLQGWRGSDDLPCGAVAGFFHPGTGPCRPAMSAPNGTAAKNPLRRRIATFLPGTLQGWRGSDDLPCGAVAGFFHPGTGPCRPAMSPPTAPLQKIPCVAGSQPFCLAPCRGGGGRMTFRAGRSPDFSIQGPGRAGPR